MAEERDYTRDVSSLCAARLIVRFFNNIGNKNYLDFFNQLYNDSKTYKFQFYRVRCHFCHLKNSSNKDIIINLFMFK